MADSAAFDFVDDALALGHLARVVGRLGQHDARVELLGGGRRG